MENKNPFGPMCKIFKAWEKYFWDQSIFKMMALNMEAVISENNQNPAQRGFRQPVSKKTNIVNLPNFPSDSNFRGRKQIVF